MSGGARAARAPREEPAPAPRDTRAGRGARESGREALRASAQPGRVRLSRILVRDSAQVDDLKGKLAAGGDFEELARRYGTGSERLRGGDVGFVDPGDLRDDLATAVRALGLGERTGLIELGGTWVVLLRTE